MIHQVIIPMCCATAATSITLDKSEIWILEHLIFQFFAFANWGICQLEWILNCFFSLIIPCGPLNYTILIAVCFVQVADEIIADLASLAKNITQVEVGNIFSSSFCFNSKWLLFSLLDKDAGSNMDQMCLSEHFDEKNIRRRVYDAFNVLMAINVIAKDKKEIRWIGFPTTRTEELDELKVLNYSEEIFIVYSFTLFLWKSITVNFIMILIYNAAAIMSFVLMNLKVSPAEAAHKCNE